MTDRLCRFRVQAIQAKMGLKSAWLMNRPPASPNHFVPPARRIWPALLPETACVWKQAYVCMVRIWMNRQALLMHLLAGRLAGRGALAGPFRGFSGQNGHCANFRAAQNIAGLGRPLYQKCRSGQGAAVYASEQATASIGHVTSGSPAPSAGHPVVMMRLLATQQLSAGDNVWADVRGRRIALTICAMPFFLTGSNDKENSNDKIFRRS